MNSTILLLGSGELGRELTISLKRLGQRVVAVDRYEEAPAMQVADDFAVIDMLDGSKLEELVQGVRPDFIVPEIEAIRTSKLLELESSGFKVIPTAKAAHLTMNRDAIRDAASKELGLKTASFFYAESEEELVSVSRELSFPVVVKPVMSSSGKGQSVAKTQDDLRESWKAACEGARGDQTRVIVEEFIRFDYEITLLTVKQWDGPTLFVDPIGHRQEGGDYQESWIPMEMKQHLLDQAKEMALKVTDYLGGAGIFGVEFFVTVDEVYFSELSPRPHDTGMVTLVSQNLSEFDLHARAILGLPIPEIKLAGPAASSVILYRGEKTGSPKVKGLSEGLRVPSSEVRIFRKPSARPNRRMGVALARGESVEEARARANDCASQVEILVD